MIKRIVGLICSVVILGLIVMSVDPEALWSAIKSTQSFWFIVALLFFIPQNIVIAWRWKLLASPFTPIGWGRSFALVLAGHSMNVILPSKLGDMTKAVFLRNAGALDLPRGISLVAFEKMLDVASLCVWALCGITLALLGVGEVRSSSYFLPLAVVSGLFSLLMLALLVAIYTAPAERFNALRGTAPFIEKLPAADKLTRLSSSGRD